MENIYLAIENDFRLYNKVASNHNIFCNSSTPCLVLYNSEDPTIEVEDVFAWNQYAEQVKYGEMKGTIFSYSSKQIPAVCGRILRFVNRDGFRIAD